MPIIPAVSGANVGEVVCDSELVTFRAQPTFNSNPTEGNRTGGILLFSDTPEPVATDNVVMFYNPVVACTLYRVFFHHQNNLPPPAGSTLRVVVRNPGSATAIVDPGPSGWRGTAATVSPLGAGKAALAAYLGMSGIPTMFVNPSGGQRDLAVVGVPNGQTGSGIVDFHSDRDLEAYVVIGNPSLTDPALRVPRRPPQVRGAFKGKDINKTLTPTYRLSMPLGQVTLYGIRLGTTTLSPVGTDQTSQASITTASLQGSYGIRYELDFPITNDAATTKCVAVVANQRGGVGFPWGGVVRDVGNSTIVQLPNTTVAINTNQCAVVVSKDCVAPGSGITKRFITIPAGGAGLPADFIVVPLQ